MTTPLTRRHFLVRSAHLAMTLGAVALHGRLQANEPAGKPPLFKISLAQWSLHRALFSSKLSNMDFAQQATTVYGIDAVEYVSQFFKNKAKDQGYYEGLYAVCCQRLT